MLLTAGQHTLITVSAIPRKEVKARQRLRRILIGATCLQYRGLAERCLRGHCGVQTGRGPGHLGTGCTTSPA
jgi:hypothetical protein